MTKDKRIEERIMYIMGYIDALEQENDLLWEKLLDKDDAYDGLMTREDYKNQYTRWIQNRIQKQ